MCPKEKGGLTRDFYYGNNAQEYGDSQWMARLQMKTSERVFDLLEDHRLGGQLPDYYENLTLLDLGCGTGFSSVVFEDNDFQVVGLDLSFDMLTGNLKQQEIMEKVDNITLIPRNLINASIERIPIRPKVISHVISLSAFNFILDGARNRSEKIRILKYIVETFESVLKRNARIVIEFYPKEKDLNLYLNAFKTKFTGGLVIDNPGSRKEQKFLILQKND